MIRLFAHRERFRIALLFILLCITLPVSAELRVGVFGQDPPMSYVDDEGNLVGFDIDIANALCKAAGFECALVQTDWSALLSGLVDRRLDVVVASVAVTDARREQVVFTRPYHDSIARFVAPSGTLAKITSQALAGKRIGVWRDTTFDQYLQDAYAEQSQIIRYSTQPGALLDLLIGRVDIVLADQATLETTFLNTEYGADFTLIGPPIDAPRWLGSGNAVAVGKENEGLRNLFDRAVADIRANGVLERIRRKWLGDDAKAINAR